MPKTIKEFQLNQSTGEVSVEYSDDSTSKFNAADMVTAQTDPVTGGVANSVAGIPGFGILAQKYGADRTGVNSSSDAIDAYIADCAAVGADAYVDDFSTFLISRPIVLPSGVGIQFGKKAWIKVAPGFVGDSAITDGGATYTSETGILNANINCNSVSGVAGIWLKASRAMRIESPRIIKAASHGIVVGPTGYQVKVRDPELFGSSPRSIYGGAKLTVSNPGQILFTATATNGSTQLTSVSSYAGLYDGMYLYAQNNGDLTIKSGTKISGVPGSTITMTQAYTGTTGTITVVAVDLNVPRGILLMTPDCAIIGGAVQHFPVGYEDLGGNSRAVDLHVWSTYHTDDNPMFFGFNVRGQGTRLIGCFSDSPRTFDNATSASQANAGIAFNIADGGDGINTRLTSCKVFISNEGGALPANKTVLPVYSGKGGLTVPDLDVIDAANTGGLGQKIVDVPWIQFLNSYIQSLATVGNGGNLYLSGAYAATPGTKNKQNSLVAGSRLSGNVSLQGSSSSAGITTTDSQCNAKNVSGIIAFAVHINLSNKGSAAGNLSITGLPFYAPNWLGDFMFPACIKNSTITGPVFAKLAQDTNALYLVDGQQNPIQATVLANNTEISVAGALPGTWA